VLFFQSSEQAYIDLTEDTCIPLLFFSGLENVARKGRGEQAREGVSSILKFKSFGTRSALSCTGSISASLFLFI